MSAVTEYQSHTEALASSAEREVLAIHADMTTGRVPPDSGVLLIAAAVNRANARATTLADTWLAVQIEQQAGVPVPAVGILPADASARLVKAVTTILDKAQPITAGDAENVSAIDTAADEAGVAPGSAETRLARLARSEPLEAAQRATHDAMQRQPLVEGWVRHMDADPCQLCVWWWREGRVWPKAHPFQTHKGCNCQPNVVLAERIQSTGFTRRLERANAPTGHKL